MWEPAQLDLVIVTKNSEAGIKQPVPSYSVCIHVTALHKHHVSSNKFYCTYLSPPCGWTISSKSYLQFCPSLLHCDFNAFDSIGLTAAHAKHATIFRNADGIALDMLHTGPRKLQVFHLLFCWSDIWTKAHKGVDTGDKRTDTTRLPQPFDILRTELVLYMSCTPSQK